MLTEQGTPVDEKQHQALDADDQPLKVGEYVEVSAGQHFGGRPFDVGYLESISADGTTVEVSWSLAGCSCFDASTENPRHLMKSNVTAYEAGQRMYERGKAEGVAISDTANKYYLVMAAVIGATEEKINELAKALGV